MTRLSYLTLALLASVPATLSLNTTGCFNWNQTEYVIAFGDSYTYVQGTAGLQNYSFIGDFLPGNFSYTSSTLLADRIVQNQTATAEGGPNWVEFMTGCGLDPGLTDPQTCDRQLWDFAFAGADISQQFTALHHPYTVPFVNQTQQFDLYAQPVLADIVDPSKTLVIAWIGINDIGDTALFTNVTSFSDFYEELITAEFDAVTADVLSNGYQDFLFMNLPPLDRTPGNVARAAGPAPNKTQVDEWDATLSAHAASFASANPGTSVGLFDVNTFLNQVMDNASNYGITNITGYCASYNQPFINTDPEMYGCNPLPEYFWFNTGHLTSHVHEILAGEVVAFLEGNSTYGQVFGV